jgi:regulator of sirC expression with transglutaminase-like and TPR domain
MINLHLGETLLKKGDDFGMRYLETALGLEPGLIDAHKFLGYAYQSKGQIKDAINELSVYLQLQPNAPDAPKVSKDVEALRARLQPSQPQG